MSAAGWLRPIADALDAAPAPVEVFVRDDDGGWDDDRLVALLDVCAAREVPVDLALIPTRTSATLARRLAMRAKGMRLRLHQHGFDHANHEPAGRRCEFGPARTTAQLADDVSRGRALLLDRLGHLIDPVFTPPWNRCVPALAPVLIRSGLRVLSRDASAGTLDHPGLAEVPIAIDWFGGRAGVRWSRRELGERIAGAIGAYAPMGLMLHHAVTDESELSDIDALLALLAGHERVRTTSIMEVAAAPQPVGAESGPGSLPSAPTPRRPR
jgi:hypothetical protein